MRALSPRRLTTRARFAAVSLTAAGALSLLLPAVAAASTGHGGGGGGLFAALPVGSIFSDILGSIGGFGKDVIKTIFGSILTLFFGGSWKVLMHPYEIVEWLIGLPGTGNTTAFVPFGNNGAGPFAALCKDTQAIGLGLLPLALANNTLHLVSGGIFTKPRDHMHDFGKVFTAAVVIIIWPWLFGQAIDLANTVTLAMLEAANANGNLWKTLAAYFVTAWAGGFLDLLTTAFLIATVVLLVGLIVMKIILMVALAFLLVVGPIAVAFYPFEFLSRILMLFGTVFLALAMVPLGWAVLFALFTAFGASVFGFSNFIHAGLIGGSMKDVFDLICSLICFYLAWKWPFLIIGRLTSIIGGNVAVAGEALSSLGRGGASAGAAAAGGGSAGGAAAAGAEGGGRLAGALQGIGGLAQGLGGAAGGAVAGLTGTTPAQFAGYGLGAKGMNGMRAASSALRRNGGAGGGTGSTGGQAGDPGSGQPVSPVGTAVANGPDAGFDAVRASGKNFSAGADALGTSGAALAGVGVASGSCGGGRRRSAARRRVQADTGARRRSHGGADQLSRCPGPPRPALPRHHRQRRWRHRRQRRCRWVGPGPRWPGRVLIYAQRLLPSRLGPRWLGCLARVTPDRCCRRRRQRSAPGAPGLRRHRVSSRRVGALGRGAERRAPLPRPVGTAELVERVYALGLARRRAAWRDRRLVIAPARQRRPHSAAVVSSRPCSSLPVRSAQRQQHPPAGRGDARRADLTGGWSLAVTRAPARARLAAREPLAAAPHHAARTFSRVFLSQTGVSPRPRGDAPPSRADPHVPPTHPFP